MEFMNTGKKYCSRIGILLLLCMFLLPTLNAESGAREKETAKKKITLTVPSNLKCYPCEKHLDFTWDAVSDPNLAGYKVYKWDGSSFSLSNMIAPDKNYFSEFTNAIGVTSAYKFSSYDVYGNESDLSDSVSGTTRSMTDDEFLDMVERATFRYFWNYAHPVSGLARERVGSGNTVTTGGSGFGLMAILSGIERGFISRNEGALRFKKILTFLTQTAHRYHGVFPHWIDGTTGATIPFSTYDDGGDLVETSFMIQGLLAARQYFNGTDSNEVAVRAMIKNVWEGAEYSWYRRSTSSNTLYWHWSADYAWQMNMPITGWDEAMICYLLGVASPTYPIPSSMYNSGWAGPSSYRNGNTYFGYKLYVGPTYGGPLFFAHYSFLGFDPRNKKDNFTNYFNNNKNHTLINRAYCISNPKAYAGYNENCWGLTASDNPSGYSAQSPTNDNGTITPSAALSSMPYTPQESIAALKYFYRTYGNKIWGEYGFKDAMNIGQNWFASSYLAIDEGPIIVMIENYRSQLLWNLFMSSPEIKPMMDAIGFKDDPSGVSDEKQSEKSFKLLGNFPNPFNPETVIQFTLSQPGNYTVSVYDIMGRLMKEIRMTSAVSGLQSVRWNGDDMMQRKVASGIYLYKISAGTMILSGKMVLQK
jgi:hypothetical protein